MQTEICLGQNCYWQNGMLSQQTSRPVAIAPMLRLFCLVYFPVGGELKSQNACVSSLSPIWQCHIHIDEKHSQSPQAHQHASETEHACIVPLQHQLSGAGILPQCNNDERS
jgi:hypothetical protein